MKFLHLGVLLTMSFSLKAQSVIPVTKMIELCHKPFNIVVDSLTARGWRYGGIDSTGNTPYTEAIVWTYKFDSDKNKALNYLTINRVYKSDTVDSMRQYIDEKYYNHLLLMLPKIKFAKEKTTHQQGYGLSQVFSRHATFVELRTFVAVGENKQNDAFYLLDVVKLMGDEEFLKAKAASKKK